MKMLSWERMDWSLWHLELPGVINSPENSPYMTQRFCGANWFGWVKDGFGKRGTDAFMTSANAAQAVVSFLICSILIQPHAFDRGSCKSHLSFTTRLVFLVLTPQPISLSLTFKMTAHQPLPPPSVTFTLPLLWDAQWERSANQFAPPHHHSQ
jgi:hypothetical protein